MLELSTQVLAFGWDPEIRGILSVAVGVVVLYGSIQLILSTNLGARLGFLVALAGFFGWMVLMGAIWWVYGIGLKGDPPSWEVREVLFDPTNSGIEQVREDFPEGWTAVPPDDPSRGEAQAAADAAVIAEIVEERGLFNEPTRRFVNIGVFEIGGKEGLPDNPSRWDRIWTYIRNSFTFLHPPHYAVVQVQPAKLYEPDPLAAPPPPEPDPQAPVITVVMVRDLGNLRFPAAMVTLGSLVIFLTLVAELHRRDRLVEEHVKGTSSERGSRELVRT